MKKLQGVPVSPGIVVHRARNIFSESIPFVDRFIDAVDVEKEIERYRQACFQAKEDLLNTKDRVSDSIGADFSEIFESHIQMLTDETIQADTIFRIRKKNYSAEYALGVVYKKYKKMFLKMGRDHLLAQRVADIDDIERRLLKILLGVSGDISKEITEDAIYVAHALRPSQASLLSNSHVKGIITETGGVTSHFAIMIRAMGLPGIIGVEGITKEIVEDQTIILDCNSGLVILDPDEETLQKYDKLEKQFQLFEKTIISQRLLPAETIDGYRVSLFGNIEFPIEATAVLQNGGEGVGLYRTEFLFVDTNQLPNEKQHLGAYLETIKILKQKPFIIRTMDLGADKFAEATGGEQERNPFLGCRSIRFCFENPEILNTQLKAILRASVNASIKILFPMISTIEELRWSLEQLELAKKELTLADIPFADNIPVGIMIEVPSAAIISNELAPLVDFFSIGTNDLVQYTLAVDRDNKRVSRIYSPSNQAVLQLIKMTIAAAKNNNIPVSLCGEIAGDPIFIPLLMGLGLTEFSLNAHSIPFVKNLIRSMTWNNIEEITANAMACHSSAEIHEVMFSAVKKIIPDYYSVS
jgi:phosphotransferase system enzyme I (PtsI)